MIAPLAQLPRTSPPAPTADLDDQAGVLGHGNETPGVTTPHSGAASAARLQADDLPASDIHLGLIHQLELPLGDRLSQADLDLQALLHAGVHLRREIAVRSPTALLDVVHRRVRVADQHLRIGGIGGIYADSDAATAAQRVSFHREGLDEAAEDLARHLACGVFQGHDVFQEHHELVAADPRQRVALAHDPREALGDALEECIPDDVAERVVDVLEPVQIDEEKREAAAAPPRLADAERQPVVEQQAVGQAGEGIAGRQLLDALFRTLAIGDVQDGHDEVRLPSDVDHVRGKQCVDDRPRLFPETRLEVLHRSALPDLGHEPGTLRGIDPDTQVGRRASDRLFARKPEKLEPALIHLEIEAVGQSTDDDRLRARLEDLLEPLLGPPQRLLGAMHVGDVHRRHQHLLLLLVLDPRRRDDQVAQLARGFADGDRP